MAPEALFEPEGATPTRSARRETGAPLQPAQLALNQKPLQSLSRQVRKRRSKGALAVKRLCKIRVSSVRERESLGAASTACVNYAVPEESLFGQ